MHSNRTSILAGTCVARGSIWASGPTEPLLRLWLSVIAVWLGLATRLPAGDVALQLATFRVDVTPAVGESPCAGFLRRVDSIEHPLELRGVIFKSGTQTFVIAAIDFCGISNSSDETLRDALARAAGTSRDRVALQSLHQHSAPVLDLEAVRLLHGPTVQSSGRILNSPRQSPSAPHRQSRRCWTRALRSVGLSVRGLWSIGWRPIAEFPAVTGRLRYGRA